VNRSPILAKVEAYYTDKLGEHGPTPPGVDWNSEESQRLRFEQLLRLCDVTRPFSLIDYGCGYGALLDHLVQGGVPATYVGFDVSAAMIEAARALHPGGGPGVFFTEEARLAPADYAVGSGIFNVRLDVPEPEWEAYVLGTLERLDALGRRGFAFNVLSRYSDPARRRADLYYADPLFLFDHCKTRFSPRVALLHDYPLYEFTVLVRRGDRA
jgi:SAM-dependent methyltransferase